MKKKIWIVVASVLLIVTAFFAFRHLSLPNYEAPFQAEDVKSVTITKNWEYRIIENSDEISSLVSKLNKIKIHSDFQVNKDQIPTGNDGYSLHFELVDGRQLDYSASTTTGFRVKFVDESGNVYITGNFRVENIWNPSVEPDCPPIPANFYAIYYQGKVHEGEATFTQVPESARLVGAVTGITYCTDSEFECYRGKTGDNVYVWEENGTTKLGVEIQQDVWPETHAAVIDIVHSEELPGDVIPNAWGVALSADNVTAKGLTIVCHQTGGENAAELHTGTYYVLQKLDNKTWVDAEYLPQEYDVAWTQEALMIEKESTTIWDVNWEWLYGELPAGEYRIGKEITNFRGAGDYDEEMVYAEFIIR